MFGHLKGLQTNKIDEMGASDDADTSTQLQGNERMTVMSTFRNTQQVV